MRRAVPTICCQPESLKSYSTTPPDFDLPEYFEPYVRQWLAGTDAKTTQWVQNAIAADKVSTLTRIINCGSDRRNQFEAEGPEGHSSSIIDLFDSLRSPINFLLDLEWPDDYQEARFFTSLAKVCVIAPYSQV